MSISSVARANFARVPKDPTTTTDASHMELMDQIKKAYGCITGTGSDMSRTRSKSHERFLWSPGGGAV